MKIGIIGTGEVGSTLTRRLTRLRHTVSIANSRGPGSAAPAITSFTPPITGFGQTVTSGPSRPPLADLAKETGAHAVTVTDAVKNVDLVVVALNTKNVPDLPKGLFRGVPSDVVVVNTSNYYPSFRDGRIAAIEEASTESGWVSSVLERPVVKVFNNITAHFLAEGGRPKGAKDRIALPVAGDDASPSPWFWPSSTSSASTASTRDRSTSPGDSNPGRPSIAPIWTRTAFGAPCARPIERRRRRSASGRWPSSRSCRQVRRRAICSSSNVASSACPFEQAARTCRSASSASDTCDSKMLTTREATCC